MFEDYSPEELSIRAMKLANDYMELDHMDGEGCIQYVREFINVLSTITPEGFKEEDGAITVALNALIYVKVFELALEKGYYYASKKTKAIEALKNAFN